MQPKLVSLALTFLVAGVALANAEHAMVTDEQLMENLKGSAPAAILENATILNMGADGKMKPIKEGTNGWTCLDPGGEPIHLGREGLEAGVHCRRLTRILRRLLA